MRHYIVQQGDSPHSIARRFGIHVRQLIAANPHKPVVTVSGQQTWSALYPGERLRIPHRREFTQYVAPPPSQVPWWQQPQVPWWQQQQVPQQGWQQPWQPPPAQQPWQRPYHPGHFRFGPRYGVGAVLAGHRYEEELRRLREGRHGYEYGGNPYGVAEAGVGDAGSDAVQALLAAGNPCDPANVGAVCAAQVALGLQPDGKWGAGTAKAAQAAVPGAPGACTPRPSWWAPAGQSNCTGPLQIPTITVPGTVPTAPPAPTPASTAPPGAPLPPAPPPPLLAMTTLDPCDPANVGAVCAAQAALGLQPDGKWGTGTAHAASLAMSNAPPACAPRPGWWAPKGQSNCGGAAPAPHAPPAPPAPHGGFMPPPPGSAPFGPPPASAPVQQASVLPGGAITVPKGGGNTMLVAGLVGAAALVGIVAVVATGSHEKLITRYRTRRAPAPAPAPHRRAAILHRKPARRKPARKR